MSTAGMGAEERVSALEAKTSAFLKDIVEVCRKHGMALVVATDRLSVTEYDADLVCDLFGAEVYVYQDDADVVLGDPRERKIRRNELEEWLNSTEYPQQS